MRPALSHLVALVAGRLAAGRLAAVVLVVGALLIDPRALARHGFPELLAGPRLPAVLVRVIGTRGAASRLAGGEGLVLGMASEAYTSATLGLDAVLVDLRARLGLARGALAQLL